MATRDLRASILALSLLGAAPVPVSLLLSSEARAQQPAFAAPLIELLQPGETIGDGATPVTLNLVALSPDGAPLEGLSLKATAGAGKIGAVEPVGPGVYRIFWTPPRLDAAKPIEISVKGKSADKQNVDRRWSVNVTPPLSHQITATLNPGQIVLGQDSSATLNITLAGGASQPLAGVELDVKASTGAVTNVTHLGGGQFTALYTPPDQQYPQLVLFTIADKRDPTRTYGAVAVPLVGKANFPVSGLPNSRVIVKIGDREFGPIQTDAGGKARVPLVVMPGIDRGTVVSVAGEAKTEEPLDLKVPPTPRLQFFPMPQGAPADPGVGVPVRLAVSTPAGAPDTAAQVTFTTTGGTISAARHEGNGVYVATFTPPASSSPAPVTISAAVADTRGPQNTSQTLSLVPTRPASMTLRAQPATLAADGSTFELFARLVGPDNQGMPRRTLEFVPSGASLAGPVRDLGGGDYQASFHTTGSGPVELLVTSTAVASTNPLARVLAFPSRDRLPNDGLSSSMITVLTLDEYGYPVANVPVSAQILVGDGSIPKEAKSNASGLAQLHYTAGRTAALVQIAFRAGDHSGVATLLQAPAGVGQGVALPDSGSEESLALSRAWRSIVKPLRIERQGPPAIAPIAVASQAAAAVGASGVGPISRLTVTAQPNSATPGSTIQIEVVAQNQQGLGVDGQGFDFLSSGGNLSALSGAGGGRYRATLAVPADAAGEIKLSIATEDGTASGFLKIPVSAATASGGGDVWGSTAAAPATSSAWGASPQPTTQPATPPATPPAAVTAPPATAPATAKVKPERTPKEAGEHPWLRVRAGYQGGVYSYKQTPLSSQGPLFQDGIAFGTLSSTGTGAAPVTGVGLDARAWVPGVKWLGADLSFSSGYYSVIITNPDQPVPDWVNDLTILALPRLPLDFGSSQIHLAARAGLSLSDFTVYRRAEGDPTSLEYAPLFVPSFAFGPELGAEVGEHLFAKVGGTFGLASSNGLFAKGMDVSVGYAFLKNVFAEAGFETLARDTSLWLADDAGTRVEVGAISDRAMSFLVSVGYQL